MFDHQGPSRLALLSDALLAVTLVVSAPVFTANGHPWMGLLCAFLGGTGFVPVALWFIERRLAQEVREASNGPV